MEVSVTPVGSPGDADADVVIECAYGELRLAGTIEEAKAVLVALELAIEAATDEARR